MMEGLQFHGAMLCRVFVFVFVILAATVQQGECRSVNFTVKAHTAPPPLGPDDFAQVSSNNLLHNFVVKLKLGQTS